MSNKKWFGIAFIILSCCEFGQVAYSKNILASTQAVKTDDIGLQCHEEKILDKQQVLNAKLTSHILPR